MIPILLRRRMPHALPSLLCSVFLTTSALAQTAPTDRRPDPLDPKAKVPVLRYESAIAQHRPWSDEKVVSWREANDAVARIGGWRVYAREARQADAPAAPAPAPAAKLPDAMPANMTQKPMPAGHSGHKQP